MDQEKIAADAEAEEIAAARAAQAEEDEAIAASAELDQEGSTEQAFVNLQDLAKYDEVTQVRLF